MRSSELVFLKLGGSLITEKSKLETPRLDVIERVSLEIAQALRDRPRLRLLLGHGSGSYGHYAAEEYGVHRGHLKDWRGYAVTSAAAQRLNRLVVDALLRRGVPVVSVQPSASTLCRSGVLLEMAVLPVRMLLDRGLVPLVYGDVALDEEQGCAIVSTEQVFAYLARSLCPDRMVIVGEVDGVFTGDPQCDKDAFPIRVISSLNVDRVVGLLAASRVVDVTGGMRSKVKILFKLIEDQPQLIIRLISGMREGAIEAALKGEADGEGTLVSF
ncbi:MAG: isopentenyl phosphate kinase [Chloroflexota bacterium]